MDTLRLISTQMEWHWGLRLQNRIAGLEALAGDRTTHTDFEKYITPRGI